MKNVVVQNDDKLPYTFVPQVLTCIFLCIFICWSFVLLAAVFLVFDSVSNFSKIFLCWDCLSDPVIIHALNTSF